MTLRVPVDAGPVPAILILTFVAVIGVFWGWMARWRGAAGSR